MNHTISVAFYGNPLTLIDFMDEPYVAMKPIVEGMGLTWQSQHEKLKQRFSSTITEIVTVAEDGKSRIMICLPLKKLFGWLMTISPNRVSPLIKESIVRYQEECDEVLWSHWTQQHRDTTVNSLQLFQLRTAIQALAERTFEPTQSIYARICRQFDVRSLKSLPSAYFQVALNYVADPIKPKPWHPQLTEKQVLALDKLIPDVQPVEASYLLMDIVRTNQHLVNYPRLEQVAQGQLSLGGE